MKKVKANGHAGGDALADLRRQLGELVERVTVLESCPTARHESVGVAGARLQERLDKAAREREATERQRAAKARAAGVRRFVEERVILIPDGEETTLGLVSAYSQWCVGENLPKAEHATADELLSALRALPDLREGDVTNRAGRRQEGFIGLRLVRDGENRETVARELRDEREHEQRTLADRAAWNRQRAEAEREGLESKRAADVCNRARARELEAAKL